MDDQDQHLARRRPKVITTSGADPLEVRKQLAGDPHRHGYHYLPPDGQMQDIDGCLFWRGAGAR